MYNQTFAQRLKQILKEKSLRPVDLVNKCQPYCKKYNIKMGRNDISQYLSGKVKPSTKKLTLLAEALDVSEVWLLGYDIVDSYNKDDRPYKEGNVAIFNSIIENSDDERDKELFYKCTRLNDEHKDEIIYDIDNLLNEQGDYFIYDNLDKSFYDPYSDEYKNSDYYQKTRGIQSSLLSKYKVLFDKDFSLTNNQREFLMNFLEEQHRKIDEKIEKGNVN